MKKEVSEVLEGYARAAEYIEQERMERLKQMTTEESWAIFKELMADWSGPIPGDDLEKLQTWRLETLLEVRQVFLKRARWRGLV